MTESQEQMFNANIRLVHHILKKTLRIVDSDPEYDDYVQEGFIGLMKACETFDDSKGFKFSTYASTCIRNSILMYLRKNDRCDGVSFHYRKIYEEWENAREQGMTISQFCESRKIPQYKIARLISLMNPIKLDTLIPTVSDEKCFFSNIIADPSTVDGLHIDEEDERINMSEIKSYIMKVAEIYEIKYHRDIWIEYAHALVFCAESGGDFSKIQETKQEYLGKKYNISQSYVSRIVKRGIICLRDIIAQNGRD